MKISKEEVLEVAQIAHLSLTEEEVEAFTTDLEAMVDFAKQLNELDTSQVDLENKEDTIYNVFRKDQVKPSMDKADILANAPQEKDGCFFVPQTVE